MRLVNEKASATAMTFVVRYPDRQDIVKSMIEVAQDELQHFAQVTTLLFERGLMLKKDEKDPYVNAMLKMVRGPSLERLIDRLLIFGVVEGRGVNGFNWLLNISMTRNWLPFILIYTKQKPVIMLPF